MVERHVASDPVEILLLGAVRQMTGAHVDPRHDEQPAPLLHAFKLPCLSARLSPGVIE